MVFWFLAFLEEKEARFRTLHTWKWLNFFKEQYRKWCLIKTRIKLEIKIGVHSQPGEHDQRARPLLLAQHIAEDEDGAEDSEKLSVIFYFTKNYQVVTNLHVVKMDTVSGPKCLMVRKMKYWPSADIVQKAPNLKFLLYLDAFDQSLTILKTWFSPGGFRINLVIILFKYI